MNNTLFIMSVVIAIKFYIVHLDILAYIEAYIFYNIHTPQEEDT